MEKRTLKFRSHLIPLVLSGQKTVTWRLFDDKDIQVGDVVDMLNWETKERFASCIVTATREKALGEFTEIDLAGHEEFSNRNIMLATYKKYYGDIVHWDTMVKIISFTLKEVV